MTDQPDYLYLQAQLIGTVCSLIFLGNWKNGEKTHKTLQILTILHVTGLSFTVPLPLYRFDNPSQQSPLSGTECSSIFLAKGKKYRFKLTSV